MTLPLAAQGMATPLLANAAILTQGVISANLFSNPELLGDPLLQRALLSPDQRIHAAALTEAPTALSFQTTVQRLMALQGDTPPDAGSTQASFERGERFLRQIRAEQNRAFADPELGEFSDILRSVVSEQPDLASGRLEDWRSAGEASRRFVDEFQARISEGISSYNGWQDLGRLPGSAQVKAVSRALKALYGNLGEDLASEIYQVALRQVLEGTRPDLIGQYRDLQHLSLFAEFVVLQRQMAQMKGMPESAERVDLYWRLMAIELEMKERPDFEMDTFSRLLNGMTYSLLSIEDRERLVETRELIARNEAVPSATFHYDLIDQIDYFYQRALSYELDGDDSARRSAYYDVVQDLAAQALRLGVSQDAVNAVIRARAPVPSASQASLADVRERPHMLSIGAIPQEVQTILRATGHWDEVAHHVDRVVLTPEIGSSEMVKQLVGSMPHGRAYFFDRTVMIATQSRDEQSGAVNNLHPWRLAALLVHEVRGHLRLVKQIQEDPNDSSRLLNNIPQERIAYAWEAQFYRDYLRVRGDRLDPSQRAELEELRFNCEAMVYACNLLLGIPVRDLDPQTLPSEEEAFFERPPFNVARDIIDWSAYPSKLMALLGQIQLPESDRDAAGLQALREELRGRIAELEQLSRGRYEFLRQHAIAQMRPLQDVLPEELRNQFDTDIQENLPGAIAQIAQLHHAMAAQEQVPPQLLQAVEQVVAGFGLQLQPMQLANFLHTFPQRIQNQRLLYELVLGFKTAEEVQAAVAARANSEG